MLLSSYFFRRFIYAALLASMCAIWSIYVLTKDRRRDIQRGVEHRLTGHDKSYLGQREAGKQNSNQDISQLDRWLLGMNNPVVNGSVSGSDCNASIHPLSSVDAVNLPQLRQCRRVIYNRVPKCGSRTILTTLNTLSRRLNYSVIDRKKHTGHNYFQNVAQFKQFIKNYTTFTEPYVYVQHMFYVNFSRIDLPQPAYINVIRDPLERLISHYYYDIYGSHSMPLNVTKKIMTLDECVNSKRWRPCLSATYIDVVVPFFCGHETICRKTNLDSLRRAKETVDKAYIVVGIQEDISAFMQVLEIVMPQFFSNANKDFANNGEELRKKYSTVKRPPISKETAAVLKHHLRYEYILYQYVKRRFYRMYNKLHQANVTHV